jgi:hypothetical protein
LLGRWWTALWKRWCIFVIGGEKFLETNRFFMEIAFHMAFYIVLGY